MTRGSSSLRSWNSIYDYAPLLMFDRFRWEERLEVLEALQRTLGARAARWRFGGAYLFWAQLPDANGEGEVIYCGEAVDLCARQKQHLDGPRVSGNQFGNLTDFFAANPSLLCGLALLVVPPSAVRWYDPPDDQPFFEDRDAKLPGEQLEGLLLKATIDRTGELPRFNSRADASKVDHDHDGARYVSLLRYLMDHRDATMDFSTFWIRREVAEAGAALDRALDDCEGTRLPASSR